MHRLLIQQLQMASLRVIKALSLKVGALSGEVSPASVLLNFFDLIIIEHFTHTSRIKSGFNFYWSILIACLQRSRKWRIKLRISVAAELKPLDVKLSRDHTHDSN